MYTEKVLRPVFVAVASLLDGVPGNPAKELWQNKTTPIIDGNEVVLDWNAFLAQQKKSMSHSRLVSYLAYKSDDGKVVPWTEKDTSVANLLVAHLLTEHSTELPKRAIQTQAVLDVVANTLGKGLADIVRDLKVTGIGPVTDEYYTSLGLAINEAARAEGFIAIRDIFSKGKKNADMPETLI